MTPNEYQELALRTEAPTMDAMILGNQLQRILHGAVGLATESGELLDGLKKSLFYGKQIDFVNMAEEVGDSLWYLAIICSALGITMEDAMSRNIAKLKARYPDKFTQEKALNRNLEAERAILEQQTNQ